MIFKNTSWFASDWNLLWFNSEILPILQFCFFFTRMAVDFHASAYLEC